MNKAKILIVEDETIIVILIVTILPSFSKIITNFEFPPF